MDTPQAIIKRLGLAPHPEGGWYKETWRGNEQPRAAATAIYFLLEQGQRSHWHKVDATEFWLWHAGSGLMLRTAELDAGPEQAMRLGPDVLAGEMPQHIIAKDYWQAAHADRGWALVSCMVSPGFEFDGFEMATEGWEPGA